MNLTWNIAAMVALALGVPARSWAQDCGPVEEVQFWTRDTAKARVYLQDSASWERVSNVVLPEWNPRMGVLALELRIVVYGGCPRWYSVSQGDYVVWYGEGPEAPDFRAVTEPDQDGFFDPRRPTYVAEARFEPENAPAGVRTSRVFVSDSLGMVVGIADLPVEVVDDVPEPYFLVAYPPGKRGREQPSPEDEVEWIVVDSEDGQEHVMVGDLISLHVYDTVIWYQDEEWTFEFPASMHPFTELSGAPAGLRIGSQLDYPQDLYAFTSDDVGEWEFRARVSDNDGNVAEITYPILVRRWGGCDAGGHHNLGWLLVAGAARFLRRR
jgi:hypothetical protein